MLELSVHPTLSCVLLEQLLSLDPADPPSIPQHLASLSIWGETMPYENSAYQESVNHIAHNVSQQMHHRLQGCNLQIGDRIMASQSWNHDALASIGCTVTLHL